MSVFQRIINTLFTSSRITNHDVLSFSKSVFPVASCKLQCFKRLYCAESCYDGKDKDPAPVFFSDHVQDILKSLTGLNIDKIFKNCHLEHPSINEEYKFLTKEELQERIEESLMEAKRLLQMPPVIQERKPISEIISFDPAIQGYEKSKLVITDISYGVSDRERIIVVREPNGILRQATWEERDRMNCIYNPRPGQFHKVPAAFEESNMKDVLDREEYEFILDFACAQLEPDDPLYHNITRKAYEHTRKRSNYDALHSTRHYGPMCFYFAWNKKIDGLLIHYIHNERLKDGATLVNLYNLLHKAEEYVIGQLKEEDCATYVNKYIKEDGLMKGNLELAMQAYEEAIRTREKLAKDVEASHGIS